MLIRIIPLFVIPFLLLACGSSSDATTGKEFLEKFKAAMKEKEASTIWDMLSKNTQLLFKTEMEQEITTGYYSGTTKERLLQEFQGVRWTGEGEKDLRKIKPKTLYLDRLQRQLKNQIAFSPFRNYHYLRENPKGKGIILFVKNAGGAETGIALVFEGDYLKYDQELTAQYKMDQS